MTTSNGNPGPNKNGVTPGDGKLVPWQDGDGKFLPGNPGGPGNPDNTKSRIQLAPWARRMANAHGLDFDVLLWGVVAALIRRGAAGNIAAAELLFRHVLEKEPRGPVNIDARSVNVGASAPGPPIPPLHELKEQMRELSAILSEEIDYDNLGDELPEEIQDELDDLLG